MTSVNGAAEQMEQVDQQVYLVVREGPTWREIFRLDSGSVATVGRDAGNRIVLLDERCSRHHCTFEQDKAAWLVRDLDSRNGTFVDGARISEPCVLKEGSLICIGASELLFTRDISRPLDRPPADSGMLTRQTTSIKPDQDENAELVILKRKSKTGLVTGTSLANEPNRVTGAREAFASLYRLIVQLISATTKTEACQTLLEGLLPAVGADIGAVLLFADLSRDRADPDELRIVSYLSPPESPYRRVSSKLSALALQEQEAILGCGMCCDSGGTQSRSLQEINARSVICAPIRGGSGTLGLLHVYSLRSDDQLDEAAVDFVLAVGDHLATILESLDQKASLTSSLLHARDQNSSLRQLLEIESDLIGDSLPMREVRDTVARVAASNAPVLVRGDSGVGKELVARAIHFNGARSKGPFVCVNCAALTESLLESELFGHEKGAFTGATHRKIGKFEQAHKGTLLLDEIGELPQSTQAKLLRVLEGQSFERVGGNASVSVDTRIIAATNRDLEAAVRSGEFRADLLFRIQVLEIQVPRLREHASDIPALAEHLLQRACKQAGRPKMRFSKSAMEELCAYDWSGNVRELRNVVERAVILLPGPLITARDLVFTPISPLESQADAVSAREEGLSLAEVEYRHILRVLKSTNGRKREAARILDINRSTLDRKLRTYHIEPAD